MMTALRARRTITVLEPGWTVSVLLVLFVLSASALLMLAALGMGGRAVPPAAPSIEAPAPGAVTCWDSPVC